MIPVYAVPGTFFNHLAYGLELSLKAKDATVRRQPYDPTTDWDGYLANPVFIRDKCAIAFALRRDETLADFISRAENWLSDGGL